MIPVIIVHSPPALKKILDKVPADKTKKNKYLILDKKDDGIRSTLEKKGFSDALLPNIYPEFRELFLHHYIDLIGAIGRDSRTRYWWATDIASKNRFTSRLPVHLYQFSIAAKALNDHDCDHLIIFRPSWVILGPLKKYMRENRISFKTYGNGSRTYLGVLAHRYKKILVMMKMLLITCSHKARAMRELKFPGKKSGEKKSFYVIKTFIYDHSFSEDHDYRDVFFGSLPGFLKKRNQNVLIFADILGNYKNCVKKIKKCDGDLILPIETFISSIDIMKALIQYLFGRLNIPKEARFMGYDAADIIRNYLFLTFKGISFCQLLHYGATKNLVRSLDVDRFLLTYENNPWEKMCVTAIREYSPKTTIIGYQHTVVPQASANMFISQKEYDIIPMPDKILTVGEAPKKIMEKYGAYERGKIEPSCGLRFEYLFQTSVCPRSGSGRILVVLEGIFEAYHLVNYALRELKSSPYQVKIRTHPVLPFSRFAHKLAFPPSQMANFRLSQNRSLKEDIEEADLVVYWGSTVALEALSMGKPVIHFEMDSIFSYDPLFECQNLKWVVSENDSLILCLEEIASLPEDEFEAERAKAKAYLNRYFFPVTEERLAKFLFKKI